MTNPEDFVNSMRHIQTDYLNHHFAGGAGECGNAGEELQSTAGRKGWSGNLHPDVAAKVRATRRRLLAQGEGRHAVRKVVRRLVELHWRAVERNITLTDAAQRLLTRNQQLRDILSVALWLAAGPNKRLGWLWALAKAIYFEAEQDDRELEHFHGHALPAETHRANIPKPTWKTGGTE
ncbi:hypothetical protein PLCT2_01788 [Planctomycetaceae bacterium]|nr:hypothetical protein PLCT2_01788 [Planctomycetaceae bacterium]